MEIEINSISPSANNISIHDEFLRLLLGKMTDVTLEAARKQKIHNLKLKTACLENEEYVQEVFIKI